MEDFKKNFEEFILLSEHLRNRWFSELKHSVSENRRHCMPFLQKNLECTRLTENGVKCRSKRRKSFGTHKRKKINTNLIEILSNPVNNDTYNWSSKRKIFTSNTQLPFYFPATNGPPDESKSAYQLFCKTEQERVKSTMTRKAALDENVVNRKLQNIWRKLDESEYEQWERNEEFDKFRFQQHRKKYFIELFNKSERECPKLSAYGRKKSRQSPNIYFYFIYMNRQHMAEMYSGSIVDRECPICRYKASNDINLLLHCESTHLGLSFEYERDLRFNLHIVVRKDLIHYSSQNVDYVSFQNEKLSKRIVIPRLTLSSDKRGKTKISQDSSNSPLRQYFHSGSKMPLAKEELDFDSDKESDDEWLRTTSKELLYEFDDVALKEKQFFHLWNSFIMSYKVIPDSELHNKCLEFVKLHHTKLLKLDLRQNLLTHLLTLRNLSSFLSSSILEIMQTFDKLNCTPLTPKKKSLVNEGKSIGNKNRAKLPVKLTHTVDKFSNAFNLRKNPHPYDETNKIQNPFQISRNTNEVITFNGRKSETNSPQRYNSNTC